MAKKTEFRERLANYYKKSLSIQDTARAFNLPWHVAYVHLKACQVLDIETRIRHGAKNDRQGAFFEREFLRLVPAAQSNNDNWKCADVDFFVGTLRVEIKSATLLREKPNLDARWQFKLANKKAERKADYYVCFGKQVRGDNSDYKVFLFPGEIVPGNSVRINESGTNQWAQFRIEPNDLAAFFASVLETIVEMEQEQENA